MQLKSIGLFSIPDKEMFWKYMDIWISKPLFYLKNCGGIESIFLHFKPYYFSDFLNKLHEKSHLIKSYSELKSTIEQIEKEIIDQNNEDPPSHISRERYLMVRIAYSKNGIFRPDYVETVQCDFANYRVVFGKVLLPFTKIEEMPVYEVKLDESFISFNTNQYGSRESERLRDTLFNKIIVWIEHGLNDHQQMFTNKLVQTEAYITLYNKLKTKYAKPIMEVWTESTDPKKAIHQAISIATYLTLLWNNEPQTYVDLGCGTGLLVHILNSENHKGIGIDVRSRKIWSTYPATTILQEKTIMPNDTFPDVNWIIGNHSDELTLLVPIITAKSSYNANFFLLPCCTYDFNGSKYQREDITQSQYRSYLDYIQNVSQKCGFNITRDRMKIPSTKRICFITKGRNYKQIDHVLTEAIADTYIKTKCGKIDQSGNWLSDVKSRETKEKVRNCTQLDKNLVSDIVNIVAQMIIKTFSNVQEWNEGNFINMSDIVKNIPRESLSKLKKECGGLQTLLRNHHFIFLVIQGSVKFRKPIEKNPRPVNWKIKPCWFYKNHPNSCPLDDNTCSFIHK